MLHLLHTLPPFWPLVIPFPPRPLPEHPQNKSLSSLLRSGGTTDSDWTRTNTTAPLVSPTTWGNEGPAALRSASSLTFTEQEIATYLTFRLASMVLSILPREKQGLQSVLRLMTPTQHLLGRSPRGSPNHQTAGLCRALAKGASSPLAEECWEGWGHTPPYNRLLPSPVQR